MDRQSQTSNYQSLIVKRRRLTSVSVRLWCLISYRLHIVFKLRLRFASSSVRLWFRFCFGSASFRLRFVSASSIVWLGLDISYDSCFSFAHHFQPTKKQTLNVSKRNHLSLRFFCAKINFWMAFGLRRASPPM